MYQYPFRVFLLSGFGITLSDTDTMVLIMGKKILKVCDKLPNAESCKTKELSDKDMINVFDDLRNGLAKNDKLDSDSAEFLDILQDLFASKPGSEDESKAEYKLVKNVRKTMI